MKIDRKSFPYLFNEYELSLSYKKSQLVRRNLTEQMLRLNEKPNEYYAIRYAYCNGYEQNSMDEKLALWFNYNLRINDLLYKNFKVEFVSESFAKTASDNAKSLLNSAGDMSYFELFGTSSGTMVLSSEYAVQYAIQKDGSCFFSYDLKNPAKGDAQAVLFGNETVVLKDSLDKCSGHAKVILTALAILFLKRFGKVETVLCGHNARRAIPDTGETLKNTAPFPVNYLDCSWLRTIVRTDGFLVRGHFRLQPCGEKHRDRKLIYIEPFQKYGYVRRAKILFAQEQDYSAA